MSSHIATGLSDQEPMQGDNRESVLVYIGLGSNLGDRYGQLQRGLAAIGAQIGEVVNHSPIYEAEAWGISLTPSPSYLNSVAAVRTKLSAEAVLDALLEIESLYGRQRPYVNAPRALDLDLLLYGELILTTPKLVVPHPRLLQRRFVLQPLNDIAPRLTVPGSVHSVQELLTASTDELLVETFDLANA